MIHPQYCAHQATRERLNAIKQDTRKLDAILNTNSQIETKAKDLENKVSVLTTQLNECKSKLNDVDKIITEVGEGNARNSNQIDEQLQDIVKLLYGNSEDEDESKRIGFIEQTNQEFQNIRNEYIDLIESYVVNATPRQDTTRIDKLEERLKKLEEKPKFSVDREKTAPKISNFEKSIKK